MAWWSVSIDCSGHPHWKRERAVSSRWVNRYASRERAEEEADEHRADGCRVAIREGKHYEPFLGRRRRRNKNKKRRSR